MNQKCTTEELLADHGIDTTLHRSTVLDVFIRDNRSRTPQDILEEVRKKKDIDKVTLYRILDLFVEKRIIRRITTFSGPMQYEILCEKHRPNHPHFVCRRCGQMECLDDMDLTGFKNQLKGKRKLKIEDIDLKLEGVCPECV